MPDYNNYIQLLCQLIAIPSPSKEENGTADVIENFLRCNNVNVNRLHNNIWAANRCFDPKKPTLLLNSHHDTVKPNPGYTRNPYDAEIIDGKLFGLGSNDAGGSAVALIATFLNFHESPNLTYNLILAITAEEECSGHNGIESLLPQLGKIDLAIVGEPTQMQMAVAERGLVVLDCIAHGIAGHAARNEGQNAIYQALDDILWLKNFEFPRKSELFGNVKMTTTIINAGTQHNVVPAECKFTVDVRVTEQYSNEEVVEIIKQNVKSTVAPRSTRLNPSSISVNHPAVLAGIKLGMTTYGSPTTSDAALLKDIPTIKLGAGDSARSHSADEYIYVEEIECAITLYCDLLKLIIT